MKLIDGDRLLLHLADYQLQESPDWGSNDYGNGDRYEAITDCIDAVESAEEIRSSDSWIDALESSFGVSRRTAKDMYHALCVHKARDNFRKQFDKGGDLCKDPKIK